MPSLSRKPRPSSSALNELSGDEMVRVVFREHGYLVIDKGTLYGQCPSCGAFPCYLRDAHPLDQNRRKIRLQPHFTLIQCCCSHLKRCRVFKRVNCKCVVGGRACFVFVQVDGSSPRHWLSLSFSAFCQRQTTQRQECLPCTNSILFNRMSARRYFLGSLSEQMRKRCRPSHFVL